MSLEGEQCCIGAIAFGGEAQDIVIESLEPEHFFNANLKTLFIAATKLRMEGKVADIVTMGAAAHQITKVTELLYSLLEFAQTPQTTRVYTEVVKSSWMRHKLTVAAAEIKQMAVDGSDGETLIQGAMAILAPLADKSAQTGFQHISVASKALIMEIAEASQSGKKITGLATGFGELDVMTGGLQPGDLIVLGGRPSHGKTATAMAMAHFIAQEHPVLVFSCEMAVKQLAMRSVSMYSQIDMDRIKNAQISQRDAEALEMAQAQHMRRELYVDDRSLVSIGQLFARAKAQQRETGCAAIVVDYMQLLKGTKERRVEEISEISAGLKALAKELNVPVIALSQLSRACEDRTDRRPIPSDLRDSGTIEQDADVIMFVYMDEKYYPLSEWAGIQQLLLRKQRQGPTGVVYLDFNGATQTVTQRYDPVPEFEGKQKRKSLEDY